MKLQQLRFFLAVVDNGLNITAASEALFTSQPGVSKQIRLLEEELDLKLFVRRGKRLESVTPAGEQVAERAQRVLRDISGIKTLADEIRDDAAGQLSLATTQTQARYVLPPVIHCFRRRFPDVDFDLHQGTSEQIAQMIAERQVDFAMLSGQSESFSGLTVLPLYQWDRVILVPRDHELARRETELGLAELARYPLVTYLFSDRPESSLMSSFSSQNLTPRIAFTARDADVIKTYVRMGLGVGVLASMAIEQGTDDDLVAIEAIDLFPRLTTWLGFHDDLLVKASHRAFIQLLAPHLSEQRLEALCARDRQDGEFKDSDLPLRGGPVPPLEARGC